MIGMAIESGVGSAVFFVCSIFFLLPEAADGRAAAVRVRYYFIGFPICRVLL